MEQADFEISRPIFVPRDVQVGKNVWEARFRAFSTSRGTKNLLERYSFQMESELQGSPAADHPNHP